MKTYTELQADLAHANEVIKAHVKYLESKGLNSIRYVLTRNPDGTDFVRIED